MTRLRGLICICGLAVALTAVEANAASAASFYVSPAGKDTNACTEPALPCKTVAQAVADSEAVAGTATIQLAAGVYEEPIDLAKPADDGLTINGVGAATKIQPPSSATEPTVRLDTPEAALTLSNLSVINVSGDKEDGIDSDSQATLDNVTVEMLSPGASHGIEQEEIGSLTMNGGGVTMASGTEGGAIVSELDPMTIQGTTVAIANGSKATGVESEFAPVSITNSNFDLGNTAGAGIETTAGPVTVTNVTVTDAGEKEPGIGFAFGQPLSISGVQVTMTNAKSTQPGIVLEYDSDATIDGLDVGGSWGGPAMESILGNFTLRDSRLINSSTSTAPAALLEGGGEGPGLLAQRSVFETSPTASGSLQAVDNAITLDSSEVLGGKDGIQFEQEGGKERTLTVSASTIDAGNLGVADPAGVSGVELLAGENNSVVTARIVGSIVLEPQTAKIEAGGQTATIACRYSNTPSQTQAQTSTEGAIACAAGTEGNASSEPQSLFSEPLTNYQLSPSSSALDSVPAGAISLPFSFTPSSTDLAGNPRSEGLACVALQDKGALELPGHASACPAPPAAPILARAPKPLAGVLSVLTISPSAFFAAPSGATTSTSASSKKKYGAKISYRDSQPAMTTFTVLVETSGRKHGKSCQKLSPKNEHGKHCTLLTKVGSFTHTDTAGANSLHFSGRFKGKKLPAGTYELKAVAHDAAGNGATVTKTFTIK